MRIHKKRIRSVSANLPGVAAGTSLRVTFPVAEAPDGTCSRAGFSPQAAEGETVLPAVVGPVTRYNAEGRAIIHRDQPMETCYRQREWTYNQRHGKNPVEVTEIVDVPYQRYPRTQVPPPSVELTILQLPDGQRVVAAPPAPFNPDTPDPLRLHINLLLELFGACDVRDEALEPMGVIPTRRLNWDILPPGRMPWPRLQPLLQEVIDQQKETNRPVVEFRLETLSEYGPEFTAIGKGGFNGYVVFGFPSKGLYVLECALYGNATYILEQNWEALSQLTKAELLNGKLHRARLIHIEGWPLRLREFLGG